ncbi:MAG: class I SAM-dependent DNA methyltransferase [Bacteriovoracaceae bacterium]
MNDTFRSYATFYDRIYSSRAHDRITEETVRLLAKHGVMSGSLLDLGCGTGTHASLFEKKGFAYKGADRSEQMIGIARTKLPKKDAFIVSSFAELNLEKKYDAIISMFHVLSYQTDDQSVSDFFSCLHRHMHSHSVAIVDFWSGPAVKADGPHVSQRTFKDEEGEFRKSVVPLASSAFPIFDLEMRIEELSPASGHPEIREIHSMRCFFADELEKFAQKSGLHIVEKDIRDNDWNGWIVLRQGKNL